MGVDPYVIGLPNRQTSSIPEITIFASAEHAALTVTAKGFHTNKSTSLLNVSKEIPNEDGEFDSIVESPVCVTASLTVQYGAFSP